MVGKHESNGRLNDASFWAVIPAGGSGTRLWPLSRSGKPKFLLPLLGDRSLIQQTVGRLGELAPIERTLVICGPAHAVSVGRQLPELPESRIVVEPAPKGSGPAIALAAAIIARHDPDAVMGSFAADHEVRDQAAFEAAVRTGIAAARSGDWLVALGCYAAAKALEELDGAIYLAAGLVSGHTLKHLAAAAGAFVIVRMLMHRQAMACDRL